MGLIQAVYYRAADGSEPVREFVASLKPLAARVVIENQIDRLNLCDEDGPPLPFPHSAQIEAWTLPSMRVSSGPSPTLVSIRRRTGRLDRRPRRGGRPPSRVRPHLQAQRARG